MATASAERFLGTAARFAVTVFVPLFPQVATSASPTGAGLVLAPTMAGVTTSTTRPADSRTAIGRWIGNAEITGAGRA